MRYFELKKVEKSLPPTMNILHFLEDVNQLLKDRGIKVKKCIDNDRIELKILASFEDKGILDFVFPGAYFSTVFFSLLD